jgi:7,8-dihydropterin-6-yl-methyl-4-(beta-D-ribofuranosyl)aminobenzene 5'-phosphate synthase
MTAAHRTIPCCVALLLLIGCVATALIPPMVSAAPANAQITVLYDAFGKESVMQKDWGYAVLIE